MSVSMFSRAVRQMDRDQSPQRATRSSRRSRPASPATSRSAPGALSPPSASAPASTRRLRATQTLAQNIPWTAGAPPLTPCTRPRACCPWRGPWRGQMSGICRMQICRVRTCTSSEPTKRRSLSHLGRPC